MGVIVAPMNDSLPPPFVGVTGITTIDENETVRVLPHPEGRRVQRGILVSVKLR